MKIYDISLTLEEELPVWPGDPTVQIKQLAAMAQGSEANVSHVSMGVHAGTHVDAPHHFLNDNRTVEHLDLEILTGPCFVLHLDDSHKAITAEALQSSDLPEGTSRVLFRTSNSHYWENTETEFQKNFVAVSTDGARWLVEHGVQLVGVDYLSVAPFAAPRPTHEILLQAGVVIVEGVNLSAVAQGAYNLYCLPLKIAGCDGAPARAILISQER